jgi:integrase
LGFHSVRQNSPTFGKGPGTKTGTGVGTKVGTVPAHFCALQIPRFAAPFAVRYLQNGGSIYALQGIMGHTSVKTTEIYLAYLTPDQQLKSKMG